jgi:hypothetical protein
MNLLMYIAVGIGVLVLVNLWVVALFELASRSPEQELDHR